MSTTRCEFLRFAPLLMLFLAFVLVSQAARGQDGNREAAKPLFDEARRLMAAGKYQEACAKLEDTRKLYAGPGVLLNLGDCYEHLGRPATAWTAFGESAAAASRAGRSDEEAEANRRRALLNGRVPHLVVQVAKEIPGLVITRDGQTVSRRDWGQAIPVDPGSHDVRADAAGYFRWESRTSVPDSGQTVTVAVPELQAESSAASPATVPATPSQQRPAAQTDGAVTSKPIASSPEPTTSSMQDLSTRAGAGGMQRTIAIVSGATGLAALGAGGILGLVAKSNFDSAQREGVGRHADSVSAVNLGDVATGITIAGGVLAATGLVLWFTAPSSPSQVGFDGYRLLMVRTFE